jgi:biopolymer transport protein ExbD
MSDTTEHGPIDPAMNGLPPPEMHHDSEAEEAEARERKLKKKAKKAKHTEEDHAGELNIVALMDAFTIILVFLIKSYASDPTQITQGDDIKIPSSTSTLSVVEAVPLVISKKGVLVNSQAVVRIMDDGKVDPSEKQGFLINKVAEALKKEAEHHKMIARFNTKVKFEGLLLIVADKDTKFETLTDVLFTAGQVEFGQFKFAVLKNE